MRNTFRVATLATVALLVGPAMADHLPRRTHAVHPPAERTHVLKPSPTPTPLAPGDDSRISAVAKDAFGPDALALLLIDNGKVVFEQYGADVGQQTPLFALSMTKTLVAFAVGEALCAGKIKNIDDLAGTYSSELTGTTQGESSIRHLLMMASGADPAFMDVATDGVNYKDFFALFSGDVGVGEYVRKDSRRATFLGSARQAGTTFQYNGRDTTALSLVIEGATGMKFQEWLDATVWKKAAAEYPAYVRVAAKDNRAIAEAGLWIAPRDMARIGMYMLAALREQGASCMKQYVSDAIQPRLGTQSLPKRYGYQLWIDARGLPQLIGHGGQMMTFDLEKQRILVTFAAKSDRQRMERLFHRWLDQ